MGRTSEFNLEDERIEDAKGVHIMLVEYTLCELASDAHESGNSEDGPLMQTKKRTVTCPDCVNIIRQCKAARIPREG